MTNPTKTPLTIEPKVNVMDSMETQLFDLRKVFLPESTEVEKTRDCGYWCGINLTGTQEEEGLLEDLHRLYNPTEKYLF